MANFQPFNRYTLFLLDKLIHLYTISGPFLDVGCGAGELSAFLAQKNWQGLALDYSQDSIKQARKRLKGINGIKVEKKDFFREKNKYQSIFFWDVLEHIKDDKKALQKAYSLLETNGHLIISVPSNPKEWGWDDEFYGHYRRYSPKQIRKTLKNAGFRTVKVWDSTFPFFWLARRLYLAFKPKPSRHYGDKEKRTKRSATEIAWNIPIISSLANNSKLIWLPVYLVQYLFFKEMLASGFEILVLAKKT